MTGIVPLERPGLDLDDIVSGYPVKSETWTRMGLLSNWIKGRGVQAVTAHHVGVTLTAGDRYRWGYYYKQQYPAIQRVWVVSCRGTSGAKTEVEINPAGSGVQNFQVAQSEDFESEVLYVVEDLSSQASGVTGLNFDVKPLDANLVIDSVSCFEVPRYQVADNSNELGTIQTDLISGQPILASDIDRMADAGGVAASPSSHGSKGALISWGVPYTADAAGGTSYSTTTAFAIPVTSASYTTVFDDAIPVIGRLINRSDTTFTANWRVIVWTPSGTSTDVRAVSDVNGASTAQSTANTSPTILTGTVTIDAEDLEIPIGKSVSDGLRSSSWDGLNLEVRNTSGDTAYIATFCVYD